MGNEKENEKKNSTVAILVAIIGALALLAVPVVNRLLDWYFPPPVSNPEISPTTITLSATSGWNKTGLILETGQSIMFNANGFVDTNGFDEIAENSGPNGSGFPCDKAYVETVLNQKWISNASCLARHMEHLSGV